MEILGMVITLLLIWGFTRINKKPMQKLIWMSDFVCDSFEDYINQLIKSYANYYRIDDAKRQKAVCVKEDSIYNKNEAHSPKHAHKQLFFSITHLPAPHTRDLIAFVSGIISRWKR